MWAGLTKMHHSFHKLLPFNAVPTLFLPPNYEFSGPSHTSTHCKWIYLPPQCICQIFRSSNRPWSVEAALNWWLLCMGPLWQVVFTERFCCRSWICHCTHHSGFHSSFESSLYMRRWWPEHCFFVVFCMHLPSKIPAWQVRCVHDIDFWICDVSCISLCIFLTLWISFLLFSHLAFLYHHPNTIALPIFVVESVTCCLAFAGLDRWVFVPYFAPRASSKLKNIHKPDSCCVIVFCWWKVRVFVDEVCWLSLYWIKKSCCGSNL